MDPRMGKISVITPNPYWENLRTSGIRDMAFLPAGGYVRKNNDGMHLDQGHYAVTNSEHFLAGRRNIRKGINNDLTLTEAKLPKPVVISAYMAVREQPAINVADVTKPMLSDLNQDQQEDVLADDRLLESIRETNPLVQKLQNIMMQNPTTLPGDSKTSRKDLMKLLK